MSNLRIIELEQQLKRRDERLAEIEARVNALDTYIEHYSGIINLKYTKYPDNRLCNEQYVSWTELLECFN